MNMTNQERKLLLFFNDLYEKTLESKAFSLSGYCRESSFQTRLGAIIVENKLLSVDKSVKPYIYTWNTIKPNIHMVRKVDEIYKSLNKERNAKHRAKIVKLVVETAQEVKVESIPAKIIQHPASVKAVTQKKSYVEKAEEKALKEFSLLWGLIKFKW